MCASGARGVRVRGRVVRVLVTHVGMIRRKRRTGVKRMALLVIGKRMAGLMFERKIG